MSTKNRKKYYCRLGSGFFVGFAVSFDMNIAYAIDVIIPTPKVDMTAPITTGC